jgi:hypothetical protein
MRYVAICAVALFCCGIVLADKPNKDKGIPPGLADKGGVPPGLAKQFGPSVPDRDVSRLSWKLAGRPLLTG